MKKKAIYRGGRMSGKSVLKIDDPEITPLEAWQEVKDEMLEWTEGYEENFDIIETALKDYEEIINTGWKNIPTNLQFLSKILDKYLPNSDTLKDLEKSLKALEIIKTKKVNVRCIMSGWNLGKYNSYKAHIRLTKEEFDLLREVLL